MDRKVVEVSSLPLSFSLFLWLPTYIPASLPTYLPPSLSLSLWLICLSSYLVYLSILFVYPSILFIYHIYLSICLSVCPSICLSVCLPGWLAGCLSVCKPENKAFLRDLLSFGTWQHQKRSKPARLPQFWNLTTSRTKEFCETSSFSEVDSIKNETSLRDFLIFWSWQHQKRKNSARLPSKMERWVQSWRPRANAFCDFSSPPV